MGQTELDKSEIALEALGKIAQKEPGEAFVGYFGNRECDIDCPECEEMIDIAKKALEKINPETK